ncbi:MAG: translation initiation factor IF-3 [Rickettsiales bacterium]|jgi:translation initiation factor IF-3|nr:translation initiation factor IF-3 [Rickettsiales bacterium]
MNEYITARAVLLVDQDGKNVGTVPTSQALEMAEAAGLDLVEMNGTSTPPIAKIMDYSKYKYEQKKKASEAKKHSKQSELKEVWIKPLIQEHDFEIKMKKAVEFLADGHKVKISAWGKGDRRMLRNKELVATILKRASDYLADKAAIDAGTGKDAGNRSSITATPKAK